MKTIARLDNQGNALKCPNHKVTMVSSELVYNDRFEFGQPIGQKCTFTCKYCNSSKTVVFKLTN